MSARDKMQTARHLLQEHGAKNAWCRVRAEAIHAAIVGNDDAVANNLAIQEALTALAAHEIKV